jgi:hypothetical protein
MPWLACRATPSEDQINPQCTTQSFPSWLFGPGMSLSEALRLECARGNKPGGQEALADSEEHGRRAASKQRIGDSTHLNYLYVHHPKVKVHTPPDVHPVSSHPRVQTPHPGKEMLVV